MRHLLCRLALLAASVSGAASAQMYYGNAHNVPDIIATQSFNNMLATQNLELMRRVFNQKQRAKEATPVNPSSAAAPAAPVVTVKRAPADFRFGRDPAVSGKVHDLIIGQLAASNGQAVADQANRLYGDVRATFAKMVQPYGLHDDNFADVMTAYMIVMWMSANQQTALPPASEVQAVQGQMLATLAPPQGDATQRQALAEIAMYQTCAAVVAREQAVAQSKPEMLVALAQSVKQNLMQKGIDMSRMTLGADGFSMR